MGFYDLVGRRRRTMKETVREWWCVRNDHAPRVCDECRQSARWAYWVGHGGTIRPSHRNDQWDGRP